MLKRTLRACLPAPLYHYYRSRLLIAKRQGGLHRQYAAWDQAQQACTGYDSSHILETVVTATLLARQKEGIFERDGVIIGSNDYSYPLLSYLSRCILQCPKLTVLDFGGALGSSYFQLKKFVGHVPSLSWHVVEQENFVAYGKENISELGLNFHYTIEELLKKSMPNVGLISSTLQYLSNPYDIIDHFSQIQSMKYVLLDRLPVYPGKKDLISVQYVPDTIYKASYPIRLFSFDKIKHHLSQYYDMIDTFETVDGPSYLDQHKISSIGLFLQRKS